MEKPQNYLSRLRRHPLLWNLALIAAIILAMAVAAHILMQLGTRHGARRTVPDLSGVQLDQAQRIARKHDLQLHINDSLFVPAYEGGIVLDQLPEGGVEVKPGRTVYITINSFRQKMVPVPYVAGRSLRQAKNMLEIAGLEIAELVYRADMATNYVLEEYCEGKPVTPTTRMEAEMGSGVTLYVGVEEGYGTTIVPRLVGLPLAQAKGRLWELGLNVGRVDFDEGVNLLNQKDNLESMFTIAHEMGHALHSYYSCHNQPVNTSDYVIFVAEVASTCNEVLLMRYLLSRTQDKKERAYLINHFLDQFKGTVYRQTMFAEFELEMGRMSEAGQALTADVLCEKYKALNELYYGPDMVCDEGIALEWARIPHFFYDYYVFQYATGFSAAVAIAERILTEGAPAVADYKRFLSGGSSTDPISLLKIAGVDMSRPKSIDSALALFGELIDELDKLI